MEMPFAAGRKTRTPDGGRVPFGRRICAFAASALAVLPGATGESAGQTAAGCPDRIAQLEETYRHLEGATPPDEGISRRMAELSSVLKKGEMAAMTGNEESCLVSLRRAEELLAEIGAISAGK